jgi:hypothetical protein
MKLDELKELHDECAKQMYEINEDFIRLFEKYMKKNARVAVVSAITMPINIILHLMKHSKVPFIELFDDLPKVYIRCMTHFIVLKNVYGEISNEEFCEKYKELYEDQFEDLIINQEVKEQLKEWLESFKKDC